MPSLLCPLFRSKNKKKKNNNSNNKKKNNNNNNNNNASSKNLLSHKSLVVDTGISTGVPGKREYVLYTVWNLFYPSLLSSRCTETNSHSSPLHACYSLPQWESRRRVPRLSFDKHRSIQIYHGYRQTFRSFLGDQQSSCQFTRR